MNDAVNNSTLSDPAADAKRILAVQKAAFLTDMNPARSVRIGRLNRIEKMLNDHGPAFVSAISADFGNRPEIVTDFAEITPIIATVRHARKHLARWSKARRVGVELAWRPGSAKIIPQPLGVVGIIAPWNYPLNLALTPLVAALAAGNRALIKPSELTPRLSGLLKAKIAEYFREDEVAVVTGGADVASAFSALPFDHLLFTGSTQVGRKVAEAAARNLTPVTLELGGKSPTIIDPSADLATVAERLSFAKFLNAGQTCLAPDYALIPQALQAPFIEAMKVSIAKQYPSIAGNADYNSIVSERHADRLRALIEDARSKGATVIEIGSAGKDRRTIAPTLILGATPEMTVMQEEIFGPLLPIVTANTLDEALAFINARDRPLGLYWFGKDSAKQRKVLAQTISGGVCINDAMTHYLVEKLPFGGVGASGMGHYHGEYGFKTFSKEKPVFFQSRFSGASVVYPPFTGFSRKVVNALRWIA
ncbi:MULTISPECIES: coniferyl aldehyde dehydrogenase [unclassified Methylobacterium]|uniref:coniferyl aldehyde dehydrogenase n=1 Tax=unclassified Methylobacterium TaxID=2615210 RepID=UPI0006FBB0A0|nr:MULTISPECIES: coniferyl aldehyde dehydrogenase [unclassified Methylobacterium]KQO56574.1 aldehyde dehydrogenase [Methylobacterium sp. Leaf86]